MTEERARHYARALARNMGITFYTWYAAAKAASWRGKYRPDDCEILATVAPPRIEHDIRQFRREHARRAA